MRHRMLILALVATCLGVRPAGAADQPMVGPAPEWVQLAAEPARGTDTAAAIRLLLNDQQVRLTPEAVETYFDNRILIQTPQGLQSVGTIAMSWQPDVDIITVHRLLVRRGAQTRDLLVNGNAFTILRREDLLEQATLTGTLTAVLQPSDLQVGDIVEFAYTRRHADAVVPDKPDLLFAWLNGPVQNVHFSAQWPKKMALRWQLRDFNPNLQESSNGDTQSIAFTLDNPSPLLQPSGAPARYVALRRVELSSFQSWAEVSRRFAPMYAKASTVAANSPLRAEVERIRIASTDPKARTTAALRLVQEQIRYVLLAMNSGALVPATADQTWQRRYGDCKAKTALLLALLRELGIEAEPVFVNSALGGGIDRQLPAISAFDHVLVRATVGGKTYWLDGTRPQDRRLDLLQVPAFHWGLPLIANGSELVRIEPQPLGEPAMAQELNVDASGGLDVAAPFQVKVVFRGDNALALKLSMDNADVTQRDQGLRTYWRNQLDGAQVTKVASSFDESTGTLSWTAEGTLRIDWYEDVFYQIGNMRLGFDPDFERPEGTDADAPYAVSFPDYSLFRANVKLPAGQSGFEVSGENIDETLAGWKYQRFAKIENAVFRAEASMLSIAAEIPAKEARAAEARLRKMNDNVLYLVRPRKLASADELRSQASKPLKSADEYVDRGYDMMRRSLYDLAVAEFSSAIALDPKHSLAWANRGMSHLFLRHFDEARTDLRKALELDPTSSVATRGLGALALEEGHPEEAITLLSRSQELESNTWTLTRRARAYLAVKDVNPAAQDLIAIIRAEPTQLSLFTNHARNLLSQNRGEDVRKIANAVLDARAGPSEGALISSELYRMTGDEARARTIASAAIAKTPTPDLYVLLASLEREPGKSITILKQALQVDPGFMPALSRLVPLQIGTGKEIEALSTLDRMETIDGPRLTWQLMRGQALVRIGEMDRAKATFASARTLARTSADFSNLCRAEGTVNFDLEQAVKDCGSSTAKDPDCLACIKMEAGLLTAAGQHQNAIAVYDKALANRPREAELIYGRGIAKVKQGQDAEGEADIDAATRIEPNVAEHFRNFDFPR
ncbi:MAG: DUF3857 domain-containing protein [Pseudomonadota bacterium]